MFYKLFFQANITLTSLDLSWNSVRMESGITLGKSLTHNGALLDLRLAHNSLADDGIQAVSHAKNNEAATMLPFAFGLERP